MNDNEIIKAIKYCMEQGITSECERCSDKIGCRDTLLHNALDLINRQRAEIERYREVVGELAVGEDGTVTGLLNGKEAKFIDKEVAETFKRFAVSGARKEFAERLCEGRVGNDPVVIAVKVELAEMEERE